MNKKGLIFKLIFFIFILAIVFFLLNDFVRPETAIGIINFTIGVNSSNIIINISNTIYDINNTPSIIVIQQNFTITHQINASNQTIISNITCQNTTIEVSCSCPVVSCPAELQCPSEVELKNNTKSELLNHYTSTVKSQIEESSNKVAQDVIFRLEPTKIELENCKQAQLNASMSEQEAYRQRDKIASDNIALAVSLGNERSEKKMLMIGGLTLIVVLVLLILSAFGTDFVDKWRGFGGGGSM